MSLTLAIKDASGKAAGSIDLPADIFDVQTNVPLIHQVVTAQLAAARQGTHKAKNRGEVSGGGKKPMRVFTSSLKFSQGRAQRLRVQLQLYVNFLIVSDFLSSSHDTKKMHGDHFAMRPIFTSSSGINSMHTT